jgi:hypothetical protein
MPCHRPPPTDPFSRALSEFPANSYLPLSRLHRRGGFTSKAMPPAANEYLFTPCLPLCNPKFPRYCYTADSNKALSGTLCMVTTM